MRLPAVRANLGQYADRAVKYVANSRAVGYIEKKVDTVAQYEKVQYFTKSRISKAIDNYVINNVKSGLGLVAKHAKLIFIKAPNKVIDIAEMHVAKIYNFVKSGVSTVWNKIHPAKAEAKQIKVD